MGQTWTWTWIPSATTCHDHAVRSGVLQNPLNLKPQFSMHAEKVSGCKPPSSQQNMVFRPQRTVLQCRAPVLESSSLRLARCRDHGLGHSWGFLSFQRLPRVRLTKECRGFTGALSFLVPSTLVLSPIPTLRLRKKNLGSPQRLRCSKLLRLQQGLPFL